MRFHRQPPGRLPHFHAKGIKCRTDPWFYASNGQQQGPFPEAQLRDLITRGTVRADTLVWTEGMSGWQRAGDIPGLVPGGSGPPSIPQPGGPPPMAAGGYGGGALVDRSRRSGRSLGRSLAVRHRYVC